MDRRELLKNPEESLLLALDGRQAKIWTALPAIVENINFAQQTIDCQPTIQGVITQSGADGLEIETPVNLPLLINVPLMFPSGGGYVLTFPVAQGDEVLVVFGSRCIDSWWQSGEIGPQMEARMHDLSDGFAILAPKSVPNAIPSISTTGTQLRSLDGTVYIDIDGNAITVNSDSFTINATNIFWNQALVGDLIYCSTAGQLSRLPAGIDGQKLTMAGGLPIWA